MSRAEQGLEPKQPDSVPRVCLPHWVGGFGGQAGFPAPGAPPGPVEHDQAPLPVQHPPPPTTGKVPCALGVNGGRQERFPSLSSCGGPGGGSQRCKWL